jgi:hypothetical protein
MSKLDSPYSTRKPVPEHSEDPEHSSSDDFTADGPVARVLLRPVLYFLFHHLRLFGWLPASAVAAAAFPKHTLGVAALYAALHRQRWWQQGLHAALGYGASYRSKVISPYKGEYDRDKKYLLCIHPHGMLVDGFHNFVAKNVMLCEGEAGGQCGTGHPTGVRGSAGCFAPVIQVRLSLSSLFLLLRLSVVCPQLNTQSFSISPSTGECLNLTAPFQQIVR